MYTADTWLFVKGTTLNVDGQKLATVPINFYRVKRDNSGGRIWQWQDESVSESNIAFFRMLAASKKTIIRYQGDKYHDDRALTDREKKAFTQILDAYEGMK